MRIWLISLIFLDFISHSRLCRSIVSNEKSILFIYLAMTVPYSKTIYHKNWFILFLFLFPFSKLCLVMVKLTIWNGHVLKMTNIKKKNLEPIFMFYKFCHQNIKGLAFSLFTVCHELSNFIFFSFSFNLIICQIFSIFQCSGWTWTLIKNGISFKFIGIVREKIFSRQKLQNNVVKVIQLRCITVWITYLKRKIQLSKEKKKLYPLMIFSRVLNEAEIKKNYTKFHRFTPASMLILWIESVSI